LRAGRRDKVLQPEEMTKAQYSWSGGNKRRGNVDFVLHGIPIECNCSYLCVEKIELDFRKLLDDDNGFGESVYLVFGRSNMFRQRIEQGFRAALAFLLAKHGVIDLSRRVDILLVEDLRDRCGRGLLQIWEANPEILDGTLDWHECSS
jgi:hypothetical protein